jgi:hypothetical protein
MWSNKVIEEIVMELLTTGGMKIRTPSHKQAIDLRWKINAELRRIHKKANYSSAIIWEHEVDVVVMWNVQKFGVKRVSPLVVQGLGYFTPTTEWEPDTNDMSNIGEAIYLGDEEWVDEKNKEVFDRIKQKAKEKEEERIRSLIDRL